MQSWVRAAAKGVHILEAESETKMPRIGVVIKTLSLFCVSLTLAGNWGRKGRIRVNGAREMAVQARKNRGL